MSLSPGTRLGPYEVLEPLGAGGMGEVYRARDTRLARDVAIKVLPADMAGDLDRLARFEREARAVSALNHPNIVTLYEVGRSEAGPYLVLERVEGQSLRDLLGAGPLPIRQVLAVGAQVAAGLAKAHAAGIVHRDLKPANVMLTPDGFVKILDFGLARLTGLDNETGRPMDATTASMFTASGVVLGTIGYLSPEQAAGRPVDFRADQFALGALLYEMATGAQPFQRETILESLTATIRDEPAPVQSERPDLPAPLAWLIERCLAKQPDDRYASTKDLARDLADLRDRLSEILRGVGTVDVEAPGRRRLRWRWVAAAASALLLVAIVAYAVATRLAPRDEPPSYRPLTFRRGLITGARFSPDGKTVYYSMTDAEATSRVFVTRTDGTESRPLDLPPGILLSVSSRNELAMLLASGLNVGTSLGMLVRVPALGGTPRPILNDVLYADWAPDGEQLAVVTPERAVEFPIGQRSGCGGFWVRIAPVGGLLVCWAGGTLQVVDFQGKPVLRHRERFIYGVAWSPDGREIWYTASEGGTATDRALYAIRLDGDRRLLARIPGAMTVYDVGPDGHSALIVTGAAWGSVNVSRRGEPDLSLDLLGRSALVGLSRDGARVLINEDREVGSGLYLRSTDGRETIRLGANLAVGLTPDAAWALVPDLAAKRFRLTPTGAGQPRDVERPPGLGEIPAVWSTDGQRLFLSIRAEGQPDTAYRVWMRDGDQPWRAVTPEGGPREGLIPETFAVSPDGRTVARRDAAGTVVLFPTDRGAPRRLEDERARPIHWSADGRYLFLREGEIVARIYRRDLESGRRELWRRVAPFDLTGVFAIEHTFLANDGELLAYKYWRGLNDLYLIQGLR